ncbi:DUF2911 domain-containing protein [Sediminibacterium soli]|uniref:DUF2911 domain-containing protein n=1 Tax=Sediminibacterium soli TaxID=2698829 RepID=UPI00137ADBFE|nr:DUF2911 domain-containing protein [Sediminibacterium soli]NCI47684.1 DUF2911 domain-containing protein [Sediminibacterium soli]
MKAIFSLALLVSCVFAKAQQKPTELDKSPMDMSYWPANYPLLKMSGKAKGTPVARVIYGRPLKNGRNIFGGIIRYNDLWRLGANEATEVEFFQNVRVAGRTVARGRYTLYCIPSENKWTMIVNKDNFCWGSFTYDVKKDQLRTDIDVEKLTEPADAFTIYFEETKSGANMVFLWDDVKASMPLSIAPEEPAAPVKGGRKKTD